MPEDELDVFKAPWPPRKNELENHESLVEEGLGLLADFRRIKDPSLRRSIIVLVASIANSEKDQK